jgi:DNA-binding transcriptional regulator YhcF (GntR family)
MKYKGIIETLQNRIFTGYYKPGEVLSTKQEFAVEFGTAYDTCAKAITQLKRQGLIENAFIRSGKLRVTVNVEVIDRFRALRINDSVSDYLAVMQTLGYSPLEAAHFVSEFVKVYKED